MEQCKILCEIGLYYKFKVKIMEIKKKNKLFYS